METIFIQGTADTPEVELNPKGQVKLAGKAMPENPLIFFNPLFDWAKSYSMPDITIDMKLEYFNTAVSKSLLDFLKIFEENELVKNVQVNWHYEEGDDDNQEAGEMYHELLGQFEFSFYEYAETY